METNQGIKEHLSLNFWVVFGQLRVNTQRRNWKILTRGIRIRSDSIKVDSFIAKLNAGRDSLMENWL